MKKRQSFINEHLRVNTLFVFYCVIIFIFLIRLFIIQVVRHDSYTAKAQNQYWNLSVIPAQRGDIISSDNVVLAGTQMHYILYAEPKKINDKYQTAHILAKNLEILKSAQISQKQDQDKNSSENNLSDAKNINNNEKDAQAVEQRLPAEKNSQESKIKTTSSGTPDPENPDLFTYYYDRIFSSISDDLYWVVLERNITPIEKSRLEELNIEGIGFEEEPVRYYPEGNLAAHVLGYVAFNEQGEKQGYFGIEGALNGDLKGKAGRVLEERDALGNPILVGGYKKSEPIKGRDIVLTINRAVQYIVEKRLKESVEKFDAKSGTVIIMDPFSGDIIAMANYPTYEPDNLVLEEVEDEKSAETDKTEDSEKRKKYEMKNLGISQTYEPGSVIKPITVSSAIELKKVTPETTFEDKGPINYSGYLINNWDGKHHGIQTVRQLLEKSNNIGASWVGHQVGSKDLSYFFKEFGLGKKTEVELEGEDTGIIRDYKDWTDIDLATASFGQGFSATPLQVLNAFNVIANGGFLVQPKIISKIIDETKELEMPNRQLKRVISKETSATMVDVLEDAAESGEAKFFILKNYRISGKTGTAQIAIDGNYHPEKTNATFVGFLTGSKKYTMIVKLEEPKKSVFAAETAAPLWMEITDELTKYYGITPDNIAHDTDKKTN